MDWNSPWVVLPGLLVAAAFLVEMLEKISREPPEPDDLENVSEVDK